MIPITSSISIDEQTLEERFVRSSGPGGQNVNKVATAVELRFDVNASALPSAMKHRLAALAGSRLNGDGILIVESRTHRTQKLNREEARARLLDLLRLAAVIPKKRHKTRPKPAAKERRLQSKHRRSEVKGLRRRERED